jgi:hypothetical protein
MFAYDVALLLVVLLLLSLQWAEYFLSGPGAAAGELLNVVSLSLADTPAEQQLSAPTLVQQWDLVNKVWPQQQEPPPAAGAAAGLQRKQAAVSRPKVRLWA